MNRVLKTFLLWLLIVALPVQGWAAAATASCGPERHASTATHEHRHDASAHAHLHDAAVATVQDDGDLKQGAHDFHKHTSCSACAACCLGAGAPPPTAQQLSAPDRTEARVASLIVLAAAHIRAGPERPPRPVSA